MNLWVVFITILLPGSMAEETFSLKRMDLEKISEHKKPDNLDKQVKRIDAFKYPAEPTTHGIGYGHHLHPFYYQGKTTTYDCALQDEWHPIVPGPALDFGVNEDNIIRNEPLLNAEYSKPFPGYWKDLLYNSEFLAQNARAYSFSNFYPQETQQQVVSEDYQQRTHNITTKPVSAPNKEITTYLTPPPFSVNTNWRNILSVSQENNNHHPAKMMDLITVLDNLKIIPLVEEDDDIL